MNEQSMEYLKTMVADSMEQDEGLRGRVRDLTLHALKSRSMDMQELRRVAQAVIEGVSLGLEHRKGEVKHALNEAMAGLDEAMSKAAEASQLALRQLVSQGKEFGENDLKQALEQLKKLEGDLLDTLSKVADSAGDKIRQEFQDFVAHTRRAGTDTGAKVSLTVEEFSNKVHATADSSKLAAENAARDVGARVAEVASGFFAALSDVLQEKSKK
jgi:hypothetical protein